MIPLEPVSRKIIVLFGLTSLGLGIGQSTAAPLSLSDTPLFLTVNIPPNVTLTLDDSGSMRRAFVPEVCGDASNCDYLDNRYGKTAHNNALYYNPSVTYTPPKNADGTSRSSSSDMSSTTNMFATVYRNGFDTAFGTVDLSSAYRPTANLDLDPNSHAATEVYMDHYTNSSGDVKCRSISGANRCQYTTNGGSTWTNMTSSSACANDSTCQTRTMPAYYHVFDASNNNCSGTDAQKREDNDCYDLTIVGATSGPGGTDERQNFANWYAFYRTRNLATVSGASLAFSDLDSTYRVAWQALNSCRGSTTSLVDTDCDGWKNNFTGKSNAINTFTSTHKSNFFDWLFQVPTDSGTPLRQAMTRVGEYYETSGENSPYDNDFTTASSGEYACRRNFHILMTDGIWNDSGISIGNVDNTSITLPDNKSYNAAAPYKDSYSDTLADVAFSYWSTDLRPGSTTNVINNLTPYISDRSGTADQQYWNPRNNPATWQHMVNYTIGLGLTDFLADAGLVWTGDMYSGSYPDIQAGTTAWPDANASMGSPGADYGKSAHDLWHAAINSRGRFFSVESPAALNQAFASIMSSIKTATPSSAALAANSTGIQTGTLLYQARFDSQDWHGQLIAYPVQGDGSIGTPFWDASTLIPSEASRNIFTSNGTAGVSFTNCTNLSASQKTALDTNYASGVGVVDNRCTDRLAWLRGDTSKEQRFAGGIFRNRRISVLGDIINSDPAFVKAEDYGYGEATSALAEKSSYPSFVSGNSSRIPVVYVGANDGMLHAFRADTGLADSGRELFAYIPAGVYGNLSQLTNYPTYAHKYFVDGAPSVGDAYLGGSWKTVLLGGLGAGGKSIYALDITDPGSFGAGDVLWEYSDATDLGYTFSQPQVARLNDGQWAAIFGNGYNSASEQAFLYVVRLSDGVLIKKIPAGSSTSNGLSTPLLYDSNDDKIIDYIYAGDLQGNLWKFDLSDVSSASWALGNGGDPLFIATNASNQIQPITTQPVIGSHPSGGALIYFGTGRYLTSSDTANSEVQSFYAIWDKPLATGTVARTELQSRSIIAETTEFGFEQRETSNETVDWGIQRGWYLELVPPSGPAGERVVSRALLKYDRIIFTTVIPSSDPCAAGGDSWLMELDAQTGGRSTPSAFDFNQDQKFDSNDFLASGNTSSGIKSTVGITKTPTWLSTETPGVAVKELSGTTGGIMSVGNRGPNPSPGVLERKYWIQIM